MTRKELYAHIKGLGLQDEVKAITGDNYTHATTEALTKIVNRALDSKRASKRTKPVEEPKCENKECCCEEADAIVALERLIEVLRKKKILLDSELDYILQETD